MEAQARMRAAKQPSDANAAAAAVAAGGRRDPAGGLRAYYTTDYATDYTTDIPRAYHALYPFLGCNAVSISFHEIPYMLVGGRRRKNWSRKNWGKKLGQKIGGSRQLAIGDQDREFPTVQVTRGQAGHPEQARARSFHGTSRTPPPPPLPPPPRYPGEGRGRATAPTGVPLHPPYNRK